MTNPYFLPADIDGSPRRPIVARVEKCRPTEEFYPLTPRNDGAGKWGWKVNDDGRDDEWLATLVVPDVALRLTRLAVIEWMQWIGKAANRPRDLDDDKDHAVCIETLVVVSGATDEEYNRSAHAVADALGVEP